MPAATAAAAAAADDDDDDDIGSRYAPDCDGRLKGAGFGHFHLDVSLDICPMRGGYPTPPYTIC